MSALADCENPWLGLASYGEAEEAFFFGRERESAELLRLVEDEPLVVLYGVSGLGKSSLLNAGLFPRLRAAGYHPFPIRLDHAGFRRDYSHAGQVPGYLDSGESSADGQFWKEVAGGKLPGLSHSLLHSVHTQARSEGITGTVFPRWETLWEYFHAIGHQLWSARNRPLVPVLVLDQFEENFTIGAEHESRRERSADFLQELSDLVYNRPPASLTQRIESKAAGAEDYSFEPLPLRVVLALREDFLPQLSDLRERGFPTLFKAPLRLRPLSLTAARDCIERPAPELLEPGVAERLVQFLAGANPGTSQGGRQNDSDAATSGIEHGKSVEPALLSVVCRELNVERQRRGLARINAELLTLSQEQILSDFYERSFVGLAPAIRTFVEREMLSPGGFRDSRALDDALARPGVTQAEINQLVARRLLHFQDGREGPPRIELTHDLLCGVVRSSRVARQKQELEATDRRAIQERRRNRRLLVIRTAVLPVFVGLVVVLGTDDSSAKVFVLNLATLWLGMMHAVLGGTEKRPYVSRYQFVLILALTLAQALILFGCITLIGTGIDGDTGWQLTGLTATALAAVGCGLCLRAALKTGTDAMVFGGILQFVFLIMSGYFIMAYEMSPPFRTIAALTPAFCAQRISDTSFVWKKNLKGELVENHFASVRNLKTSSEIHYGQVYENPFSAIASSCVLLGWGIAGAVASRWRSRNSPVSDAPSG